VLNAYLSGPVLLLAFLLAGCGGSSSSGPAPQPTPDTTSPDVTVVSEDGETNFDESALESALSDLPMGDLSDAERDGLLLMREEEKLAGDVYRYLYELHDLRIFSNIAASEDTHTAAVKKLLDRYELQDPAAGNGAGVFTDMDMQMLYDSLSARGTPSLLDGLYVGVLIEELDIFDLDRLLSEVVGNDDIVLVYEALQKGSRNHLRSFYAQLVDRGGSYTPEYLSQEAFDTIVNSEIERGP
jgi:hypothetical protein